MFWSKESFHSRDGRVVLDRYDPDVIVNYELDAIVGFILTIRVPERFL